MSDEFCIVRCFFVFFLETYIKLVVGGGYMRVWFFVLLVVLVGVQAQVVIEQVYPNPVGTESGGEGVLLKNYGSVSVALDGWVLATESSARDVVLGNVSLLPGALLLIGDVGWDEKKDDVLWRRADVEETMTLGNADSGVALIDRSGDVVDAVGWGGEEVLVLGVPVKNPLEGQAILRRGGVSGQEFVVGEPELESDDVLVVVVEVGVSGLRVVNVSLLPDSDARVGVQVRPGSGVVVRVFVDGSDAIDGGELVASLGSQRVVLGRMNGSVFEGVLDVRLLPAGMYEVVVSDGESDVRVLFEYVAEKRVVLEQKKIVVRARPGRQESVSVQVENVGNVPVSVRPVIVDDFGVGEVFVSVDGVFVLPDELEVHLAPGEKNVVMVRIEVNEGVSSGRYKLRLRFVEK